MDSGIYAIRNLVNNKRYIGSTKNFDRRKKEHFKLLNSSKHWNIKLSRSVLKHGIENFIFEIVELVPYIKNIIIETENKWIASFDSKRNGYNIADASFGDILSTHPDREEIKKKISIGLKKTFSSMSKEERKLKFSRPGKLNPMYGQKRPRYVIDAMTNGIKQFVELNGYGPTKGITKSESHKIKMSENAKLKIGSKNPFYGKTHSEEFKEKMRNLMVGVKPGNSRPVFYDGVRYESITEVELATGIKKPTLHWRANSKNPKFNNIYFEDEPKTIA